nr:glycosyltransferase N-terminal domain-containing protein [Cellulophaga baltica]
MKIVALFNKKLSLFVNGRKNVFSFLQQNKLTDANVIWVHTASLGEYEQGLPVIEKLKKEYPTYKILVTFFSPSGYEVKKDSKIADYITYLPLDTKSNAKKFLALVNPKLVIFVKYEIWPNYLNELHELKIPTLLIASLFKERQLFFKSYGGFMKKSLEAFSYFFVQNENSKKLLASIGFTNVSVGGDTRFDRVLEILERDNQIEFMDDFKGRHSCFVAGSTWPEDEAIIVDFINSSNVELKYVLAPHTIKKEAMLKLKTSISKKTILYSELNKQNISDFDVLILDTIGILTKVYSYAAIGYVGGAFATGLHNTLEPAVFEIPVIIGPDYSGFKEAEDLVAKKGVISISNKQEFTLEVLKLLENPSHYKTTSLINKNYISQNSGATKKVIDYISLEILN